MRFADVDLKGTPLPERVFSFFFGGGGGSLLLLLIDVVGWDGVGASFNRCQHGLGGGFVVVAVLYFWHVFDVFNSTMRSSSPTFLPTVQRWPR